MYIHIYQRNRQLLTAFLSEDKTWNFLPKNPPFNTQTILIPQTRSLKMKGIHISCKSQSATAIWFNMEHPNSSSSPSSSYSAALLSRSPVIDRCNPIIRDSTRAAKNVTPPASSKPSMKKNKNVPVAQKENGDLQKKKDGPVDTINNPNDGKIIVSNQALAKDTKAGSAVTRKSWSCTKPSAFISPPGSTRYLLSEKVVLNSFSDFDPTRKMLADETCNKTEESCWAKRLASSGSPYQVVVLRVSLHCRGCERKLRKHISKMEGVTSFSIDFAAKKVTVTGNVTPLEVLSSISKVKNAQIWPPTVQSTTVSP